MIRGAVVKGMVAATVPVVILILVRKEEEEEIRGLRKHVFLAEENLVEEDSVVRTTMVRTCSVNGAVYIHVHVNLIERACRVSAYDNSLSEEANFDLTFSLNKLAHGWSRNNFTWKLSNDCDSYHKHSCVYTCMCTNLPHLN